MNSLARIPYEQASRFLLFDIIEEDWNKLIDSPYDQLSTPVTFFGMLSTRIDTADLLEFIASIEEFSGGFMRSYVMMEIAEELAKKRDASEAKDLEEFMQEIACPGIPFEPRVAYDNLLTYYIFSPHVSLALNNMTQSEVSLPALYNTNQALVRLLYAFTGLRGFGKAELDDICFYLSAKLMEECIQEEARQTLWENHFFCTLHSPSARWFRMQIEFTEEQKARLEQVDAQWEYITMQAPHMAFLTFQGYFELHPEQSISFQQREKQRKEQRERVPSNAKGWLSLLQKVVPHAPQDIAPIVQQFLCGESGMFRSDGIYTDGKLWMEYPQ